ncbi:MAG: hypothetical protein HY758_00820 [Nitrospirae bacterium]|nr:hypothetical protein [Nitrospirota bacterium]
MKGKTHWINLIALLIIFIIAPGIAAAHCDTLEGPVVLTARAALEKGDVTPLLKWVGKAHENEIKAAFNKTLNVRKQSAEAKELADMYFFETLVRIHRAGEGAPYTGLKPAAAVDPAVELADKALETGSADKLVDVLTNTMAKGIRDKFAHAKETKKHADDDIAAGREFVKAYVFFTHYVEGLHGLIKAGPAHNDAAKGPVEGGHAH